MPSPSESPQPVATGARVVRFPADGSLPRETGGSASALSVSRPARRSLALRPAWSLSHPRRPFLSKCFRRCRYLHHPLRLLPAGTTVSRAGFAPAGGWCLSTAHSLKLIVAPQARARGFDRSPGCGTPPGIRWVLRRDPDASVSSGFVRFGESIAGSPWSVRSRSATAHTQREPANDDAAPEQRIGFTLLVRW